MKLFAATWSVERKSFVRANHVLDFEGFIAADDQTFLHGISRFGGAQTDRLGRNTQGRTDATVDGHFRGRELGVVADQCQPFSDVTLGHRGEDRDSHAVADHAGRLRRLAQLNLQVVTVASNVRDLPTAVSGMCDHDVLLRRAAGGDLAECDFWRIERDVGPNKAINLQLYFGVVGSVEDHGDGRGFLADKRVRVVGRNDGRFFVCLDGVFGNRRRRAPAAATDGGDVDLIFVDVVEFEMEFALRTATDGSEVVTGDFKHFGRPIVRFGGNRRRCTNAHPRKKESGCEGETVCESGAGGHHRREPLTKNRCFTAVRQCISSEEDSFDAPGGEVFMVSASFSNPSNNSFSRSMGSPTTLLSLPSPMIRIQSFPSW